jgi:TolB-like protein
MANIFLSYAREDVGAVEALAGALESAGHTVWWDRYVKGGHEYAPEIERALRDADKVVVLWSHNSVASGWVRDEAGLARDTGRLVPATIDGTPAPLGFGQYQLVDLRGWKGRRKAAAVDALFQAVGDTEMPRKPRPVLGRRRIVVWTVAAAVLVLAALSAVYFAGVLQPRKAEAISMAVLPFEALPADETNSPFAEGVAEEIHNQLAGNPKLRLIGRTSAETFRGTNADARTIGSKLHVAYLLDGSVRRAGNQVKVAVALVRANDGVELWRHSYSGKLDDIFTIQANIGQQVEGQLRAQFAGPKGVTASTLATSGEVYGYYLTARGLIRSRELAKVETAIGLLRRTLEIDPNYAPAWAELAVATRTQGYVQGELVNEASVRGREEAIGFANRAVALAPQLAEAHLAKAIALEALDDTGDEGKTELLATVRLDPNSADAWGGLARIYEWEGYFPDEMVAFRRQIAIDPLWWPAIYHASDLAWALGYKAEAQDYAQRIERENPGAIDAHLVRAAMAYNSGDFSGALQEGLAARRLSDAGTRPFADRQISHALRAAGFLERARPIWWYPVDDSMWSLWNGRALSRDTVDRLYRDASLQWSNESVTFAVLKTLASNGRSAEAVALYRKRFSSPDAMVRFPSGHLGFLEDGATIALALRDTGQKAEADRLLALLRSEAQKRLDHGPVPNNYRYYIAMAQAVGGNNDAAIRSLEQSAQRGWLYAREKSLPDLAMEPAFRSLVKDPRFQRIVGQQRAWQNKERREMEPLLSQLDRS